MARSIEKIVADLRFYVAGRGRDDNFMFSKAYSPSSRIFSVDFSRWIGKCLITQDTLSLAVFRALYSEATSFSIGVSLQISEDGEIDISDPKYQKLKKRFTSFKRVVNRYKKHNQYILDFPFEKFFVNEIGSAKIDLLTAWFLGYNEKNFPKIMMAHRLVFRNASTFLKNIMIEKRHNLSCQHLCQTT